ncbi:MAG: PqqD family protein [Myxococcales bacterium]|nr:PqqD family protein [Myxococcales bacterium]MDH3845568.1 PqqD family protein [Myxococcales bacterium]
MNTELPKQHYRVDPHARFRVLDGEGIFVLQKAGEVLVINQVGAFIVEQLQAERTLDDVVTAVTERYSVDRAQAQTDAGSLIEALLEAGALAAS